MGICHGKIMMPMRLFQRGLIGIVVILCAWSWPAYQGSTALAGELQSSGQEADSAQDDSNLVIETELPLPDTFPGASYEFRFKARGGVPTLHWRVEKGTLPAGLKLEDDGRLHGQAERPGEFRFTIAVRDGGQPQQAVQKEFVLRVLTGLTLNWKNVARVNGSRIEGSAEVSNATPDDMDLTFIVLAVPGNGRAVAIGYQHFVLRRGTLGKELPFGENLPHGGYVVHVDAVGEVAAKKLIYRQRMQTPSMLQVTVGP
jgi:hypothetical protein